MDGDLLPSRAGLTPEKITREHQQRLAIVYVRQSTPQQVERNQESTSSNMRWSTKHSISAGRERPSSPSTMIWADPAAASKGGSASSGWWRKWASAMSGWFWASRCLGWRDLVGTGINCWRYALCS